MKLGVLGAFSDDGGDYYAESAHKIGGHTNHLIIGNVVSRKLRRVVVNRDIRVKILSIILPCLA